MTGVYSVYGYMNNRAVTPAIGNDGPDGFHKEAVADTDGFPVD